MTVRELYNWCKAYRYKDAEVYFVKDWKQVDDNGCLTDLYRVDNVVEQVNIVDEGLEFRDVHEVLISVESQRATARIN